MSRQAGWIITGALSIAALGGTVAVAEFSGPDQTQDLGGALDVTGEGEPASSTGASPGPADGDSASPDASPSGSPSSGAGESSAVEESGAVSPTAVTPAPPSTYQQPSLESASAWSPASPPSPETWSPVTPASWSPATAPSWSPVSAASWSAPSAAS